jgi:hypothetical protein
MRPRLVSLDATGTIFRVRGSVGEHYVRHNLVVPYVGLVDADLELIDRSLHHRPKGRHEPRRRLACQACRRRR